MEIPKANIFGEIIQSNSSEAFSLHEKSRFGEKKEGKIQYSINEGLYLVKKNKLEIFSKNKLLSFDELIKKFQRIDKKILLKDKVFTNLREKGYVVKTGLKFGADFRVYDKGKSPGKEHAKWIIFVNHETNKTSWHEFSAKMRVAHSTKKNLLLAIVDEESDVTYYEVNWIKP